MSEMIEYKCPCCGGAISFDSGTQKMKCPYCDTEFDIETLLRLDAELKNEQPDDLNWEDFAGSDWKEEEADILKQFVCKSCGGEIITEATTTATSCPFCGNPVVMSNRLSGNLRPDLVIPFKLDKKQAVLAFQKHLCGKRLLPKVFKDQNHIEEIKGVYVPFWLFDADAKGSLRCRATKVRTWSTQEYIYTETSFFAVHRAGDLSFEHVPVDGSQKMPDDLMDSLEPFDFREAVDFQTAYLAGYLADRYDVTATDSVGRANERIKISMESALRNTIRGYATVTTENNNVQLKNNSMKYALLPVWMLKTKWNNKTYTFAMNGQTGKFVGDLPLDRGAFTRWLLGLTGGVGAAVFAILSLIWRL